MLLNFNAGLLKDGIRRGIRQPAADRLVLAVDSRLPTRGMPLGAVSVIGFTVTFGPGRAERCPIGAARAPRKVCVALGGDSM